LTSWFRRPDGSYFADRDEVGLPLESPRIVVRLEDSEGECVAVQTVDLWDPTFEVQPFLLGRRAQASINRLERGSACILMMRPDFATSAMGVEWCLIGQEPHLRRWVLIDHVSADLNVIDAEGRVVWQADVTTAPSWVADMHVDFDADHPILRWHDRIGFRFTRGPGINIEYACCNGSPLQFLDPARTRTERKRVTPERAAGGFHLRIGLERSGERAIFRHNIFVPVQGLALERNGEWTALSSDKCISTTQASSDAFRLFTNGPNLLLEGNTIHRRLGDRPGPLGRLLGTGGPIRLIDVPYNPSQDVRLADHAIDFGAVLCFQSDAGGARLELHRAVPPRPGHQLVLWSNRHGLCRIDHDCIGCENDGRVWRFKWPWNDEPEGLLCGIAYEGYRLGLGWSGQWHRLFSTDPAEHPGLEPIQQLAIIRWFCLPGLLANRSASTESMSVERNPAFASVESDRTNGSAIGKPMLLPLAISHPVDLLAVALFDRGLEELPAGIKLAFEDSADDREQFDVTVIELLLDYLPTVTVAEQIRDLFSEGRSELVNRLFGFHPLLGARVLYGEWVRSIKPQARHEARQDLRRWRRTFAGVPPNANFSDDSRRRQTLREEAEKALSEGTGPGCQGMMPEIERAALRAVFYGQPLTTSNRANLLVALGSGDFRQYLGLRLLDDLENRL
jgi:hypothetical protein